MKNFVVLASLFAIVVVLVFVRCNSNNGFIGGGQGTPGLAQGNLVDGNGNPVNGGTIWIQQTQFAFQKLGQSTFSLQGLCPDPLAPGAGTTADGQSAEDCVVDGDFQLPCDGTGAFVANTLDASGAPMSDVTVVCGSVSFVQVPEIAASPSPSPTP